MATPTRKSPSTKNATSPGKNDVRLLQRIRVLKEKCNKLEIERDEAESREQRLRDTLETEISSALERRSRSMVEKVKAADASKSPRIAHAMFSIGGALKTTH